MVFHVSVLAQSQHLYVLSSLFLEFLCLVIMSHVSRILTVSLSGVAKCLFCAETLAHLAESKPLGPFAYCKTAVLVAVAVFWL